MPNLAPTSMTRETFAELLAELADDLEHDRQPPVLIALRMRNLARDVHRVR